ncbi:AhpC/TSA antioxidant enzyme-domain-containing protein [Halenospora varia]|nr:AhpC/TSA antioxidant enzyme-domain-containing protein [Halenospora varia]
MAIFSGLSPAKETSDATATNGTKKATPQKASIDTSRSNSPQRAESVDNTAEFSGDVSTNNEIPTQEILRKVDKLTVLDADGKAVPFKDIYNGPGVARRVLVIFIRHFFCGNCQEFIRSLAASITPADLLQLPTPTFIAVIGCGSPSLIPMYQNETACPFPVYADPTKKLYDELGMLRTLNLGTRPEYQRKALVSMMTASFVQSLKMLKGGKAFQGGDYQQVGGEFMFEPVDLTTPICAPGDNSKQLGAIGGNETESREEKRVTWCHRMKNTRDHAEIPELREVLGFDEEESPGHDVKRWQKALRERKGTGLSSTTGGSGNSAEKASV